MPPSEGFEAQPRRHYRLRSGAALAAFADCTLLFSENEQQIHLLNDTAGVLAQRLMAGADLTELDRTVEGQEAGRAGYAADFLAQMVGLGLVVGDPAGKVGDEVEQRLVIAGVNFAIRYRDRELCERLAPAYAHLETGALQADPTWFDLSSDGPLALIAMDDHPAEVVELESAGVILKGMILEQVLEQADYLCALHAGMMVRDGRAALLVGHPGAGKSTMAMTLSGRGFVCEGDDVTLVDALGRVRGVGLAPAIKEKAWGLARTFDPRVEDLPIHVRPDGQRVRFLGTSPPAGEHPISVAAVVLLDRDGSTPPTAHDLSTADALAAIMAEARSLSGRCSVETFAALSELIRGARCVRLSYGEAADGATAIEQLVTK